MSPSIGRTLALLGCAAFAAVAAPEAHAFSRAGFASAGGVIQPQYLNESKSRLRVEGKDNAGQLVGTHYCHAVSGAACPSTIAGAVNNVVVLEIDLNREEVVLEKCKGVVSTIPQLRCENGDLEVTLRVRLGELVIKSVPDSSAGPKLGSTVGTQPVRYEFLEDPTKYWNIGSQFWYDSAAQAYRFPAGHYKVFAPDLGRYCKPVQVNPGFTFELPAGGRTTIELRYRGTECTIEVSADIDVAGLTVSSDSGPFTCIAKGQSGVPSTRSVCTGLVPFNVPLRISATVPAGFEPYFEWVGNECQQTPMDRTKCHFTPRLDHMIANFTNIRMTTKAAGTAPPPDPVGLAFATGASAPDDGSATKGATAVPMLQLRATAQNGSAMIQALTLKASGSGRDDLDLTLLKVVVDANGNGVFDAGETVLAEGRPAGDNGELRLAFGSAMPLPDTADLLVVADIGSEVHSASAAALGGATLVLAFGLVAVPATRRRRIVPVVAAMATTLCLLAACGGSDGEPDPAVVDAPAPAPLVLLTYRIDLIAVEATDTASPAAPLTVRALPVEGATITVQQ